MYEKAHYLTARVALWKKSEVHGEEFSEKMAEVATPGVEKSLDDFFAKRDKKKKKEKGKGKETGPVSVPASLKKTKKEKEKSMKNENQDATIEKVAICVAKLARVQQ